MWFSKIKVKEIKRLVSLGPWHLPFRTRGDTIPEESRFTIPDFRGIGPLRDGLIPQKESILFKESRFTIPFFEESCHL